MNEHNMMIPDVCYELNRIELNLFDKLHKERTHHEIVFDNQKFIWRPNKANIC